MGQPISVSKIGPVGTFDPKLFSQMLQGLGSTFWWSRATECPCGLEGSDQWRPNCSNCGGDGWWYVNPEVNRDRHTTDNYVAIQAAFANSSLSPSILEVFGHFGFGEAQITVDGSMRVGHRDRFIGIEQEMPYSELILSAGPGTTIPVGKSGRTTAAQKTALRYEPVFVNFIADEDEVLYYRQTDYRVLEPTLTEPGRLQWLSGRGPVVGKKLSVHYNCRPVWIVEGATYGIQVLQGPEETLKGTRKVRHLPSTFKVKLDYLTPQRGT